MFLLEKRHYYIGQMSKLTTETELRFNVKTISTEDMISMLEDLGWKEN